MRTVHAGRADVVIEVGSRVRLKRSVLGPAGVLPAGYEGRVVELVPADDLIVVVLFAGLRVQFLENEIGELFEEIS